MTPNLERISKNSKLDNSMSANQKSVTKNEAKTSKRQSSSELEAMEQNYLNEVMKS